MNFRKDLTTNQRATPLQHTIDPGFVHYRKVQTILIPSHMQIINNMINDLPDLPEWQKSVQIDHISCIPHPPNK